MLLLKLKKDNVIFASTRLAAVGFDNGSTNYRVYYQDANFLLKESRFEAARGWHVRENCIVAGDAKEGTAIAATSWDDGCEIRLYYLDGHNKIREVSAPPWRINPYSPASAQQAPNTPKAKMECRRSCSRWGLGSRRCR